MIVDYSSAALSKDSSVVRLDVFKGMNTMVDMNQAQNFFAAMENIMTRKRMKKDKMERKKGFRFQDAVNNTADIAKDLGVGKTVDIRIAGHAVEGAGKSTVLSSFLTHAMPHNWISILPSGGSEEGVTCFPIEVMYGASVKLTSYDNVGGVVVIYEQTEGCDVPSALISVRDSLENYKQWENSPRRVLVTAPYPGLLLAENEVGKTVLDDFDVRIMVVDLPGINNSWWENRDDVISELQQIDLFLVFESSRGGRGIVSSDVNHLILKGQLVNYSSRPHIVWVRNPFNIPLTSSEAESAMKFKFILKGVAETMIYDEEIAPCATEEVLTNHSESSCVSDLVDLLESKKINLMEFEKLRLTYAEESTAIHYQFREDSQDADEEGCFWNKLLPLLKEKIIHRALARIHPVVCKFAKQCALFRTILSPLIAKKKQSVISDNHTVENYGNAEKEEKGKSKMAWPSNKVPLRFLKSEIDRIKIPADCTELTDLFREMVSERLDTPSSSLDNIFVDVVRSPKFEAKFNSFLVKYFNSLMTRARKRDSDEEKFRKIQVKLCEDFMHHCGTILTDDTKFAVCLDSLPSRRSGEKAHAYVKRLHPFKPKRNADSFISFFEKVVGDIIVNYLDLHFLDCADLTMVEIGNCLGLLKQLRVKCKQSIQKNNPNCNMFELMEGKDPYLNAYSFLADIGHEFTNININGRIKFKKLCRETLLGCRLKNKSYDTKQLSLLLGFTASSRITNRPATLMKHVFKGKIETVDANTMSEATNGVVKEVAEILKIPPDDEYDRSNFPCSDSLQRDVSRVLCGLKESRLSVVVEELDNGDLEDYHIRFVSHSDDSDVFIIQMTSQTRM